MWWFKPVPALLLPAHMVRYLSHTHTHTLTSRDPFCDLCSIRLLSLHHKCSTPCTWQMVRCVQHWHTHRCSGTRLTHTHTHQTQTDFQLNIYTDTEFRGCNSVKHCWRWDVNQSRSCLLLSVRLFFLSFLCFTVGLIFSLSLSDCVWVCISPLVSLQWTMGSSRSRRTRTRLRRTAAVRVCLQISRTVKSRSVRLKRLQRTRAAARAHRHMWVTIQTTADTIRTSQTAAIYEEYI